MVRSRIAILPGVTVAGAFNSVLSAATSTRNCRSLRSVGRRRGRPCACPRATTRVAPTPPQSPVAAAAPTFCERSLGKSVDRYGRRDENFVPNVAPRLAGVIPHGLDARATSQDIRGGVLGQVVTVRLRVVLCSVARCLGRKKVRIFRSRPSHLPSTEPGLLRLRGLKTGDMR
jgi:hypothetical protein